MSHALTRVGEDFGRRNYYRRDANCPAGLIYRIAKSPAYARADVWISNISEGGILLLVEGLLGNIEDLYVVLPGLRAKIHGKAVRQGDFTVAVEFTSVLGSQLVDRIAAMEPMRPPAAAQAPLRNGSGPSNISRKL